MLAQGIYSVIDTGDGVLLLCGLHRSRKPADDARPFGRGKELRASCTRSLWIIWDRHDPVGYENLRHGAPLSNEGVAGSGFDTRVKNYVFTLERAASAVGRGVRERTNQSVCNASRGGKRGKDMCMMGGASIIASFLDEGEIDEFMIHIVPEFICEGIPLIAARRRTVPLKVIS